MSFATCGVSVRPAGGKCVVQAQKMVGGVHVDHKYCCTMNVTVPNKLWNV